MWPWAVIKVGALFLIYCSMGLYLEISGPTLIDVKLIFNASFEEVSRSVSGRGAGGFVGALIGGILIDRFGHSLDLVVGVCETAAAVAIAFLPFSPSISTVWIHYFTIGFTASIINMACIRSVITLWPERTASLLQLLNVGYGLGALFVPILVNPFLAVLRTVKHHNPHHPKEGDFVVVHETRLQNAFVIIGVFTCLLSLVFYLFHFKPPPLKGHTTTYSALNTKEDIYENSFRSAIKKIISANSQCLYNTGVCVLLFLFFFNEGGGQEMFAHFVRSFSVEVFKFNKTQASYLNTTFWLGITLGRICSTFTATYIPARRLFRIQILSHAICTTLLNLYASTSPPMLWIGTFAEGFLISPLFASGIAYANTLLEVTGACLMVIQLAGSAGDLVFIWVAGELYNSFGPQEVLYGVQFMGLFLLIVGLFFRLIERYKKEHVKEIIIT